MTLSAERLQGKLPRPFRYCASVDSTNDMAKAWLADGAPDGAAVVADEQRRGRGRKGRHWHTPPNVALALSVILRPSAHYLSRVSMIGALSVYDLAKAVGCENVGIKWPNDVQVNGRKVSGILSEVVWENDKLTGVILGIGVNVRLDLTGNPLQDTAINLEDVVKERLDRAELVAILLRRVDYWYCMIAAELVFESWRARLNMLKQRIEVEGCTGIALDVTTEGALLVRDDSEIVHEISAGDVFTLENREMR